jgi:hypothetical protein
MAASSTSAATVADGSSTGPSEPTEYEGFYGSGFTFVSFTACGEVGSWSVEGLPGFEVCGGGLLYVRVLGVMLPPARQCSAIAASSGSRSGVVRGAAGFTDGLRRRPGPGPLPSPQPRCSRSRQVGEVSTARGSGLVPSSVSTSGTVNPCQ